MIYYGGILSIILSFIVGCSLGIGEERKEIHQELELYGLPPTIESFSYVSPPSAVGEGDCSFPAREVEIYEGYNRQYEEGTWALTTRQTMRRLAYCASQG
ncbi:MAG TPA: hypothetical protein VNJ29_02385, partial [Candidatus Nitrosotenuis sp.]|nr:hypothetical protein [Candidatus Nitrosotenuis sp.]